jgi:hypothetical protein
MRIFISSVASLLLMMPSASADFMAQDEIAVLKRLAPHDLKDIQNAFAKSDSASELSAFASLENRINSRVSEDLLAGLPRHQMEDDGYLYWYTWRVGIRMFSLLTDKRLKDQLLSYWDEGLQSKTAYLQIAALGDVMDRNFLTPKYWVLLNETTDSTFLEAFAYAHWKQGNDEDEKRLKDRIKALSDHLLAGILQNGINWRHYRLRKTHLQWGETDFSPAHVHPLPF